MSYCKLSFFTFIEDLPQSIGLMDRAGAAEVWRRRVFVFAITFTLYILIFCLVNLIPKIVHKKMSCWLLLLQMALQISTSYLKRLTHVRVANESGGMVHSLQPEWCVARCHVSAQGEGNEEYLPVSHGFGSQCLTGKEGDKTRFNQRLSNQDDALDEDEDDEIERTSKLSSEDSEEASAYFYDSDGSGETGITQHQGEMDLLGEILDTLSTHSSDQGKLSGAKSLDFFRSMDDIDYKAENKSNAPSESNLTLLCSSANDQAEWNLGQDDSVLHGKQLPPSPRKQVSSGGQRESLSRMEEERSGQTFTTDKMDTTSLTSLSPIRPSAQFNSLESFKAGFSSCQNAKPNETLSNTSEDQLPAGLAQQPSILVPWEKGGKEGDEAPEEGGLLQEVVSLCKLNSAFHYGLNISKDSLSSSRSGNKTMTKAGSVLAMEDEPPELTFFNQCNKVVEILLVSLKIINIDHQLLGELKRSFISKELASPPLAPTSSPESELRNVSSSSPQEHGPQLAFNSWSSGLRNQHIKKKRARKRYGNN
ncbi:hypothetical protein EK904_003511 [Melospiza melodia maxima]|nr:hypothetical protein EK904_003511 [Melospiza melodia maxima]